MTTVKQLIEFLQTQDQDAEVRIQTIVHGWDYSRSVVDLDLRDHISYTDNRGNSFVADDAPHKNKRYLEFGD
jgi:hypothetical protein